mmetsp:Transcript_27963/g.90260  ORF Transcript_27963/g.90260 Transcript_27963/m.90260 type:complete len:253 (-) Transcript_27963:205-963(-)
MASSSASPSGRKTATESVTSAMPSATRCTSGSVVACAATETKSARGTMTMATVASSVSSNVCSRFTDRSRNGLYATCAHSATTVIAASTRLLASTGLGIKVYTADSASRYSSSALSHQYTENRYGSCRSALMASAVADGPRRMVRPPTLLPRPRVARPTLRRLASTSSAPPTPPLPTPGRARGARTLRSVCRCTTTNATGTSTSATAARYSGHCHRPAHITVPARNSTRASPPGTSTQCSSASVPLISDEYM